MSGWDIVGTWGRCMGLWLGLLCLWKVLKQCLFDPRLTVLFRCSIFKKEEQWSEDEAQSKIEAKQS